VGARQPQDAREWDRVRPHRRDASEELGAQRLRYEQYDAWRRRRIAQQLARNDMTAVATGHAICQLDGADGASLSRPPDS
jgi:hypothetical protein